jgi:hypothetical protein
MVDIGIRRAPLEAPIPYRLTAHAERYLALEASRLARGGLDATAPLRRELRAPGTFTGFRRSDWAVVGPDGLVRQRNMTAVDAEALRNRLGHGFVMKTLRGRFGIDKRRKP